MSNGLTIQTARIVDRIYRISGIVIANLDASEREARDP
jgi:hypothetical protein